MADWHPISLAVLTGPNTWLVRNPRSTDHALGRIDRLEFGLFREVWFRAAVHDGQGPHVLGYTRNAEAAADAIRQHKRADSHTKPHPGYPTMAEKRRAPMHASRTEPRDG
ncbi:hypothetical protein ACFFGH_10595 [Lysobacter korlensis]|uniref:Uncharacterized protein n=1 Tax=Lysobacter korlensis TaxID=553636 RepID=A0ABV6RMT1_9GAMM